MATKKLKNQKALKKRSPEELEHIWDEEADEAWDNLNPKQKEFLMQWLTNGYNASEAHRQAYESTANDKTAAACGSRRLANANIQVICGKLDNDKKTDMILIKKAYRDALVATTPHFSGDQFIGEYEDHKTRIAGAEKLAKINGELMDKAEVKVVKTLIINQAQIEDLNKVLQATGQPEITAAKPIKQQTFTQTTIETVEPSDPFTVCGGDDIQVID